MTTQNYTTKEAAEAIGVTRATLQSWIQKGVVRPPELRVRSGKPPVRLWANSDVTRLLAVKKAMQKRKTGRPKKGKG